ncbi:tetratricopeptide repeat protein [Candidatus Chlorohelix sp.]|uniref:tetratricopeptide repeat protein n=1 Tax=Candidatus Chlorohelix sp. TaxID=3139201 RepID=UPI0030616525
MLNSLLFIILAPIIVTLLVVALLIFSRRRKALARPELSIEDNPLLENDDTTSIPRHTQQLNPTLVNRSATQLTGIFGTIRGRATRPRRIRPEVRPRDPDRNVPKLTPRALRRAGLRSRVFKITDEQVLAASGYDITDDVPKIPATDPQYSFESTGFDLPQSLNEFGAVVSPSVITGRLYTGGSQFGKATFQTTAGREFVERGTDVGFDYEAVSSFDYEKLADKSVHKELDFELEYADRPYTSFFSGISGSGILPFSGRLFERTEQGRDFVINGGSNGNGHYQNGKNGNGLHVVGESDLEIDAQDFFYRMGKGIILDEPIPPEEVVVEPTYEPLVREPLFNYGYTGTIGFFTRPSAERRRLRRLIRRDPFAPFRALFRQRNRKSIVTVALGSLFVIFTIIFGLVFLSKQIDRAPIDAFSVVLGPLGQGETYRSFQQGREISVSLQKMLVTSAGADVRFADNTVENEQQALRELQRTKADTALYGYLDDANQVHMQVLLTPNGPFDTGGGGRISVEMYLNEPSRLSLVFPLDSKAVEQLVLALSNYYSGNYDLAGAQFQATSQLLGQQDIPELHVLAGISFQLLRSFDGAVREYDTALTLIREKLNPLNLDPDQVTSNRAFALLNLPDHLPEVTNTLLQLSNNHPDNPHMLSNYLYLQLDRANGLSNEQLLLDMSAKLSVALVKYPDFWAGYYYLGLAYYGLKDYNQAEVAFTNVEKLKPDYPPAYNMLGMVSLDRYYKFYLGRTTPESIVLLDTARVQLQSGFDRANARRERTSAYANAVRQTQDRNKLVPALEEFARIASGEADQAKFGLARDILERGRIEGNKVGNVFDQALRWIKSEKTALEDARERFQQITNDRKEFGDGYFYLGEAYYLLGDVNNANANYELAKSKPNPRVLYYSTVAEHLVKQDKKQEAVSQIQDYTKKYPNSSEGYVALADLHLKISQPQDALNAAAEAVRRNNRDPYTYLVQARAQIALGRNKDADASFQRASQLEPNNPDIPYEQGLAFYKLGQPAEALKALQQVTKLKPDAYPYAHYLIGRILQDSYSNPSEAVTEYLNTVKQDDGQFEAWLQLAQYYSQVNNLEDAIKAYEKVLKYDPKNYVAAYSTGLLWEVKKQNDTAERYYRQAIELQPGLVNAYTQLSRLLANKNVGNSQQEAITTAQIASRLDATNPQTYGALGYVYLQAGDYRNAIQAFDKTVSLNVNYLEGYYLRATAYIALKQYDRAQADINQVIRLKPEASNYYLILGQIAEARGNGEEALVAYDKALNLKLANPSPAYVGIGNVYLARGQMAVARTNYQKAVTADPNNLDANYQLASAYFLEGKFDQATTEFEKVVKRQNDRGLAWYYLGILYSRQNRVDNALQAFKNAVQFDPSRVEAHYELGNTFRVKDQREQAQAEYDATLKLNPTFYPAYLQKGLVLESFGHYNDARTALSQALKSGDPIINQQARDALTRIGNQ